MATFSQIEAAACVVQRCESVQLDSVHQYYVFAVHDNNDIYYEWENATLSSTASQVDIKNSIIAELQTIDKITPLPVTTYVPDSSGIIGATLSAI